jgi:hypothetical protein
VIPAKVSIKDSLYELTANLTVTQVQLSNSMVLNPPPPAGIETVVATFSGDGVLPTTQYSGGTGVYTPGSPGVDATLVITDTCRPGFTSCDVPELTGDYVVETPWFVTSSWSTPLGVLQSTCPVVSSTLFGLKNCTTSTLQS